ncbi:hypothetical protein [Micromonospora craterilacus]|uniref:hypothetical protein n=1 Tax=Micromonospora craterilacus TaxID=1655439 RepID=UPI0011B5F854|nr:hypothetical protein [Micromonospora craterilacus]
MRDRMAELMDEYRSTDADGLLIIIGEELTRGTTTLHSPQELKGIALRFISSCSANIRQAICGKRGYLENDEAELAVAVASTISESVPLTTALLVGLYCARRGVRWLCEHKGVADVDQR